jgi:hypothetical protein
MNKSENRPEKRSQRDYNFGFKLAVISQVEKGEFTYKQAQKKYGIQSIDVSNLSSGIYLVNFRNSEGKSSNKKIVKKKFHFLV